MESWYRENEGPLKAYGLRVTLSVISENAKSSRYLDIESASKFGRLTVWVSGEAEIQIQNVRTNQTESLLTLVVRNPEELTEALSRLVKSVEPKYA